MAEKILLCLCHMSGKEQDYINEAFADNWVVPLGPNVTGFEQDLERFTGGGKKIAAVSAGTAALHLALILAGVERDDEVICQSMTFSASANPVAYQGARPVFVDSEPLTWDMSPDLLEEAIRDRIARTGRKPKAIVVVDLYGMPAQMDRICEIADRYGITLIEDAAEALGSTFCRRECGTFGRFGALSFNGNKMITTSGGGALVCPDEETRRRAVFLATQAREPFPWYEHREIGYNYRMSNICAGIGRGQMHILEEHLAHHRHVHDVYARLFADFPGITLHSNPDDRFRSNYWLCNILIDSTATGFTYEDARVALAAGNIESRPLWKPMHLQPVFADAPSYTDGTSEHLFGRGLCLPAGPWVEDRHLEKIVNVLKSLVK